MTATPDTAWSTYKAGSELPAAVLLACQQLDTGDPNLPEPLGGKISNVFLDALLAIATD